MSSLALVAPIGLVIASYDADDLDIRPVAGAIFGRQRLPSEVPAIALTVTANVSLVGAEVRIYDLDNTPAGSLGTELAGTETNATATFSASIGAGNEVWIQIMLAGYKEFGLSFTMPATATSFLATLVAETDE